MQGKRRGGRGGARRSEGELLSQLRRAGGGAPGLSGTRAEDESGTTRVEDLAGQRREAARLEALPTPAGDRQTRAAGQVDRPREDMVSADRRGGALHGPHSGAQPPPRRARDVDLGARFRRRRAGGAHARHGALVGVRAGAHPRDRLQAAHQRRRRSARVRLPRHRASGLRERHGALVRRIRSAGRLAKLRTARTAPGLRHSVTGGLDRWTTPSHRSSPHGSRSATQSTSSSSNRAFRMPFSRPASIPSPLVGRPACESPPPQLLKSPPRGQPTRL